MAVKQEHQVYKIRVNEPVEIGKRANITIIGRDGSEKTLSTSPIQSYFVRDLDESIHLHTARSVYYGELDDPKAFHSMQDFYEAVGRLSVQTGAMEL